MPNQYVQVPSPNVPVGRFYPPGWTSYSPTIQTTGGATALAFTSTSFSYAYDGSILTTFGLMNNVSTSGSNGAPLTVSLPPSFSTLSGIIDGQNFGSLHYFKNGVGQIGGTVNYCLGNSSFQFTVNTVTGTYLLDSNLAVSDGISWVAHVPVIPT